MDENDQLRERANLIVEELAGRLDAELSPGDDCAVATAIRKALVIGFQVGAGHTAYVAHLHGVRLDVNYLVEDFDHDEWAELYGQR